MAINLLNNYLIILFLPNYYLSIFNLFLLNYCNFYVMLVAVTPCRVPSKYMVLLSALRYAILFLWFTRILTKSLRLLSV